MPEISALHAERRVVVGVDGSENGQRALKRAMWEAEAAGASLVVVHCWPPRACARCRGTEDEARHLLDEQRAQAVASLGQPSVSVELRAEPRPPVDALTQACAGASLLVLGRTGHTRGIGALLGSTVKRALHHVACPVMVVPPGAPDPARARRVVVGLDGSDPSDRAVLWGAERAVRDAIPLQVVHAWNASSFPGEPKEAAGLLDLERVADRWLHQRVAESLKDLKDVPSVTSTSVHAYPSRALLSEVDPQDLLVVGARGSGGFPELLLGSVASQIVEHAVCPAVIVR